MSKSCSSPICTKNLVNIGNLESGEHGICIPDCDIIQASPSVLSATVFPPALGPLIIMAVVLLSISKFIGTASSPKRGCLQFFKLIWLDPFSFKLIFPLICIEYFALAKIRSNVEAKLIFSLI